MKPQPRASRAFCPMRTPLLLMTVVVSSILAALNAAVNADAQGDWGYDDIKPAQSKKESTERQVAPEHTPAAKTSQPQKKPASLSTGRSYTDQQAWLEIFALIASTQDEDDRAAINQLATLSNENKKELAKLVDAKLLAKNQYWCGIGPIYAAIADKIQSSPNLDYKDSYRIFFKSLLRHAIAAARREMTKDLALAPALALNESQSKKGVIAKLSPQADLEVDQNALQIYESICGPSAIADEGPPVLTEDALRAYGDMTSFLWSARRKDKSVDSDENRQVFSQVIMQKFKDAPDEKAKKAIANFDLTWASFRLRYLDAAEEEREKLRMAVAMPTKDGARRDELTSDAIKKLYKYGPWAEGIGKPVTRTKP